MSERMDVLYVKSKLSDLQKAAKELKKVIGKTVVLKHVRGHPPTIEDTLVRRRCFYKYLYVKGNPENLIDKLVKRGFTGGVEEVAGEQVIRLTKVVTWRSMDYTARVVVVPFQKKLAISVSAKIQDAPF